MRKHYIMKIYICVRQWSYTNDVAGMEKWLGVLVKQPTRNEVEISIRMDSVEQKEVEVKPKSA